MPFGGGGAYLGAVNARKSAKEQAGIMREQIAENKRQYEANVARLEPYQKFGGEQTNALREWLAGGGGKAPTGPLDVTIDPGYEFRQKAGMGAVEGTAAGKGMLKSGDTLRALENYGQDLASQEYGNAFSRAFNSRQTDFSNKLKEGGFLQNLVAGGQSAAAGQGGMGVNLSNINSQLAGQIPSSNAMANFWAGQGGKLGGDLKNIYEGGKEGYNALSNWWNKPSTDEPYPGFTQDWAAAGQGAVPGGATSGIDWTAEEGVNAAGALVGGGA